MTRADVVVIAVAVAALLITFGVIVHEFMTQEGRGMRQIEAGPPDSCGQGYRCMRVKN